VTDINRHHTHGSALQQTIGESSGRSANVQANFASHIHSKKIQSSRQLKTTAADKRHGFFHRQRSFDGNQLPGFFQPLFVAEHLSGQNQSLRFGASFDQAAFDQQFVQSLFGF
jgi:hypothetical protein